MQLDIMCISESITQIQTSKCNYAYQAEFARMSLISEQNIFRMFALPLCEFCRFSNGELTFVRVVSGKMIPHVPQFRIVEQSVQFQISSLQFQVKSFMYWFLQLFFRNFCETYCNDTFIFLLISVLIVSFIVKNNVLIYNLFVLPVSAICETKMYFYS